MDVKKYQRIIPAFYACYDEDGSVSPERVRSRDTLWRRM